MSRLTAFYDVPKLRYRLENFDPNFRENLENLGNRKILGIRPQRGFES